MSTTTLIIIIIGMLLGILTITLVWLFATTGERPSWNASPDSAATEKDGDYEAVDLSADYGEEQEPDQYDRNINIRTRGEPDDYDKIGYLYTGNDDQTDAQSNVVLPLYGRATYGGAHKWNYYTEMPDTGIKVPIRVEGKDCEDNVGCEILYNNDIIFIRELQAEYQVRLYKNKELTYIPPE